MAGYIAKVLCPHLIFIKPDFTKYTAASRKVMEVLSRYDPNYAAASLDEAYLNMTEYVQKSGLTPAEAVQKMRDEVKIQTGLTVSAGVAPNAMLAKVGRTRGSLFPTTLDGYTFFSDSCRHQ
jgi:DNA polymerase kappa